MHKFKNGFLGLVHCFVLGLPLIFVLIMVITALLNGFTSLGTSMSTNYESSFVLEDVFQDFNANYQFNFGLVDIDFLYLMEIETTNEYVLFTNWYLNYLINFEMVSFLPELLLIIISMAKRIVLSWSHKIGESY